MNHPHSKIMCLITIFTAFSIVTSCSKDNDLLEQSVLIDAKKDNIVVQNYLVDDNFQVPSGESVIIDVLANDVLENSEEVKIIDTSDPTNGSVVIIEEKTIMYVPNDSSSDESTGSDENPSSDSFTYTVEVENEGETATSQEASVTIEFSDELPDKVKYWKDRFDLGWNDYLSKIDELKLSKNKNQEYYFLGYYVDGLVSIWRATGNNSYLDTALDIIDKTIDDSVSVGDGYLGWPSADGKEVPLWDSFYWRFVTTLTRVMHQSPNLRSSSKYQNAYVRLLDFSEKHIWERYERNKKDNFYRINTHMASHWARIGMELYLITNKQKYKDVFEEISFGPMPYRPSNLRQQLRYNTNVPSAYVWNSNWEDTNIQDTSHAGAIISFWVEAYDNEMYWDRDDIDALISTFNDVVCKTELTEAREFVDGTGRLNTNQTTLHEWMNLGRYNQTIQNKIRAHYDARSSLGYVGLQPVGIAALNAKILADGRAYYPEN